MTPRQLFHRSSAGKWVRFGRPEIVTSDPVLDTPWLPFDMPERSVLKASSKFVFAHYFTPFPWSADNDTAGPTEYYQQYWMPPGALEGSTNHELYGGLIRDRKPYRAPRSTPPDYDLQDKEIEVQQGIDAGLDGFMPDLLSISTSSAQRQRLDRLITAVNNVGDTTFRLTLMPDGTTSDSTSASTLADYIGQKVNATPNAFFFQNGRLFLPVFDPEKAPNNTGSGGSTAASFWSAVIARLSGTYGIQSDFCPFYVATWTSTPQAPSFNSISWGHGRWGDRDPVAINNTGNSNRGAASYCRMTFGKPWVHWATPGDVRPSTGHGQKYWEAGGSDAMRGSWMAAIDGDAAGVQIPTWDDFAEASNICPSRDNGYSWVDINAYYLCWFKLGQPPPVIRDAVYLLHRKHNTSLASFTSDQSLFMAHAGSTAARNEVEALVFLTAPATVTINVGGALTTFQNVQAMPNGQPVALKAPLANGAVSATVVRNGTTVVSVTSAHTVSSTQSVQDLAYRATSSLAGVARS